MTNPPTEEELSLWEELAGKATPGPWVVTKDECASCGGEWDIYDIPGGAHAKFGLQSDAAFIAASRQAVPRLLERVRELATKDYWQNRALDAESRLAQLEVRNLALVETLDEIKCAKTIPQVHLILHRVALTQAQEGGGDD